MAEEGKEQEERDFPTVRYGGVDMPATKFVVDHSFEARFKPPVRGGEEISNVEREETIAGLRLLLPFLEKNAKVTRGAVMVMAFGKFHQRMEEKSAVIAESGRIMNLEVRGYDKMVYGVVNHLREILGLSEASKVFNTGVGNYYICFTERDLTLFANLGLQFQDSEQFRTR